MGAELDLALMAEASTSANLMKNYKGKLGEKIWNRA